MEKNRKKMPKFEFHFHDKVGAQIAHVDTFIARFDKDMNMQVMHVDEMTDQPAEDKAPAMPDVEPTASLAAAPKPQPSGSAFAERTKAIMRKAATKNGVKIESRAKGHLGSYTFYINAEAFCKAMDDLLKNNSDKLSEFLGNNLNNTQVTKVCFFIGHVIRMNVINDSNIQITDLLFAFDDYYPSRNTLSGKLSDKTSSQEQKVLMGTFEGLLKRYIA